MTEAELIATFEAALKAALPPEEWQRSSIRFDDFSATFKMPCRPEPWEGEIWYGDGDQCATVYGNLGLDLDGGKIAALLATATNAAVAIIGRVKALEMEVAALRLRHSDEP